MQNVLSPVTEKAYPEKILPSLRTMRFVCPLCRGRLNVLGNGYQCPSCQKNYLLHAGIPDFRIFPDPYLNFEEDRERTEIVLAALEKYDLETLLEHYWSFSDITPEALRPKFIRSVMLGEQKGERTRQMFAAGTFKKPIVANRVLEIGSGTGSFLAIAAPHYEQVVGVDIAMRWLHVSRRRFLDKGMPVPPLVCCCAEFLPFADDSFDLVVATSTLEFVNDVPKVLSECARMLKRNGAMYLNSVNRYAFARDPYAYLWGVGFLPRSLQANYVKWRRGASYENIHTVSYRKLNQMIDKDFAAKEFALPDVPPAILAEFSPFTRLQIKVYRRLKKLPGFKPLFKRIGPGWDVVLRKTAEGQNS